MKRCPLIDDVELPLNAEVRRRFGWRNISQSFPTTAEVMSLKGCRLACFHLAPEIPLKRRFCIQLLKEWLNSGCKSGHIKANLRHTLSLNFVFLLKKTKTKPSHIWVCNSIQFIFGIFFFTSWLLLLWHQVLLRFLAEPWPLEMNFPLPISRARRTPSQDAWKEGWRGEDFEEGEEGRQRWKGGVSSND